MIKTGAAMTDKLIKLFESNENQSCKWKQRYRWLSVYISHTHGTHTNGPSSTRKLQIYTININTYARAPVRLIDNTFALADLPWYELQNRMKLCYIQEYKGLYYKLKFTEHCQFHINRELTGWHTSLTVNY